MGAAFQDGFRLIVNGAARGLRRHRLVCSPPAGGQACAVGRAACLQRTHAVSSTTRAHSFICERHVAIPHTHKPLAQGPVPVRLGPPCLQALMPPDQRHGESLRPAAGWSQALIGPVSV